LEEAGYGDGERLGTVCWNHYRHYETYFGVPYERWQERPLALVVPNEGVDHDALEYSLRDHVLESSPKWWVPDIVVFIDEVPETATGEFSEQALREEYGDESLVEGHVPDDAAPGF